MDARFSARLQTIVRVVHVAVCCVLDSDNTYAALLNVNASTTPYTLELSSSVVQNLNTSAVNGLIAVSNAALTMDSMTFNAVAMPSGARAM
jgi:hypothetical protein